MRYNGLSSKFAVNPSGDISLAASEDKLYQAEYHGSGTFTISKPKRKEHKKRQTKVKNPQRGARR